MSKNLNISFQYRTLKKIQIMVLYNLKTYLLLQCFDICILLVDNKASGNIYIYANKNLYGHFFCFNKLQDFIIVIKFINQENKISAAIIYIGLMEESIQEVLISFN